LRGLATSFDLVSDAGAFYYRLSNSPGAPPVDEVPFQGRSGSESKGWISARPHDMATSWMDAIAESTARVQALSVPSVVSEPSVSEAPLALFREERFAQALAALRALPSDTARDPELSLLEAVLLFHQNECDASEQICRELLLHRELTASAHYLLALCSEARTRFDTAALHDQAAIELDPSFSLPRLHLGRMLRRLGATERAAHELASARQLLEREDAARLTLFGAGLGRSSLLAFCDAELVHARREGGT
jgi:chemotaxis protein methyltransferase CheR